MAVIINNTKLTELNERALVGKKLAFKAECEAWLAPRRHLGFTWNTWPCPADQEAQANFVSVLALIGIGAPGPFLLHDNDNVDHMITAAQVQDLAMNMAGFVQSCYVACWAAKAEITNAMTEEACRAGRALLDAF